ncbi:darobactin family peptide antibiotic [Photorhabdus luminescens]|uniref:darobactin family peptide antibiotic n=1 Tax=Photorhabdus luminescens TaxID=29488 RepID=UPI00223F944F|nr:darobactin family peptide antibiotic [Photorhabdus luminescens]MCW7763238.1 darobactin family peptide antibiotic [Photorhabdus luminescens subsp. venezuelensis]
MQNISIETNKNQELLHSLVTSFKGTELLITEKALDELANKTEIPETTDWNWTKKNPI